MLFESNGANTWSTSSVWDRESLVEIEMTNVSANIAWRSESKLSIHIGSIHVHLSSILMDDITNLLNRVFENSVG